MGTAEAGGTAGAASEVGQETSHPHSTQPLPLSPCSLSHCLSLSSFPALLLPREIQLLANGVAFCWLSSIQGLDEPLGEGRTWIITFGGRCSPKSLRVPRTPLMPWLKLVALNQLRLLHLKGRSAPNPGFVS